MTTIYQRTIKEKKLKILEKFKTGSWIYAEKPSQEEIEKISRDFDLEQGHLKDALDPFEVPRLEVEKNAVYIFTRMPFAKNGEVITTPLLIVAGENFVLTVSQEALPFLEKFKEEKEEFYTTQKTKLVLQLFFEINNLYNRFILDINRQIRQVQVQIEKISNKEIIKFVKFESCLNDFLGSLVPANRVLSAILSGKHLALYEKDKDLVEDLSLKNEELIELAKSNLKNIVNIRNAYSTIISNSLNQVIKLLTSLTIVLTIPMIITSFYGMNVRLPLANSPLAVFYIALITALLSFFVLMVLILKKWI